MIENCEKFVHVPGFCGIYLLLRGDEVVYVGQSTNVYTRISTHYQALQRHRKGLRPLTYGQDNWVSRKVIIFDSVKIMICPKGDLGKEEIALIQKYLPKNNTFLKRSERPDKANALRSMPMFQEMMRQAEIRKAKEAANPLMKKRRLPRGAEIVERSFQQHRDERMKVTLPKLKCLEDELTG